jgi:hypothetical protein
MAARITQSRPPMTITRRSTVVRRGGGRDRRDTRRLRDLHGHTPLRRP